MTLKTAAAILLAIALLAAPRAATAGWATSYTNANASVTNTQANTTWAPVAALWTFYGGVTTDISIARVSQGYTYTLGSTSITNATTNAQTIAWNAPAYYPFTSGDVFRASSTMTNGTVQIIRTQD